MIRSILEISLFLTQSGIHLDIGILAWEYSIVASQQKGRVELLLMRNNGKNIRTIHTIRV